MIRPALLLIPLAAAAAAAPARAEWKPPKAAVMTRWSAEVSPRNALPAYPRPQIVRKEWKSLNGLWDYAVTDKQAGRPERFDGQILVPFCIESALSGVMKPVGPGQLLWYALSFEVPSAWRSKHVLLHFGAVDWEAAVFVNGKQIGTHRGGYDPFSFDITEALTEAGPQKLLVRVWDPTDAGPQPRGKQVLKPKGIWYTAVTGIWRTVWLEPIPAGGIERLKIVPDVDAGLLRLTARARAGTAVTAVAKDGGSGKQVASATGPAGKELQLKIDSPKLWSPDSPFLYDLKVTLTVGGKPVDEVASYFGMRKIAVGKDRAGLNRLMLNGKPVFQLGLLDQGWWPDGLYTAATDEALRYDVEITRKLGFNMARKHVKIEPARWYYHCDKLGLLVWQDMPSPRGRKGAVDPKQFRLELGRMIDALANHPCIVMWVPFNEGWGQHDTAAIVKWIKARDPSRLVNNASGWHDKGVGDVHDVHKYPGPMMPKLEPKRAAVLGEFGGLGLPVKGHLWRPDKNWGYKGFKNRADLTRAYVGLIGRVAGLAGKGLSAAVYTQTTDVERETNGQVTYDREVFKMDLSKVRAAHRKLYVPPPEAPAAP